MLGDHLVNGQLDVYGLWHYRWARGVQAELSAAGGRLEGLYSDGTDVIEGLMCRRQHRGDGKLTGKTGASQEDLIHLALAWIYPFLDYLYYYSHSSVLIAMNASHCYLGPWL